MFGKGSTGTAKAKQHLSFSINVGRKSVNLGNCTYVNYIWNFTEIRKSWLKNLKSVLGFNWKSCSQQNDYKHPF